MGTREPALRHQPALDGLRAVAVLGVLGYHHDEALPGGFLGVSAFFTLSGFLITRLLAVEHAASGRLDLRRFWARRLRRLLPAAWLTLLAVLGLGAIGAIGPTSGLHGDVVGAQANVANWWFLAEGSSYGDLFADPSPVAHFWSLAIEEQLYLALPLLLLGLLGRPNLRLAVVAALIGASLGATLLAGPGDRAYFGTDTRAGEVLIGALAALVVTDPRVRFGTGVRRGVAAAGCLGLLALPSTWLLAELDDRWLYQGGLLAHAAVTVAVIGAASTGGPTRAVLSRPLLTRLGRISYGVYLVHWPAFLVLDADRVPDPAARLGLRLAVTVALAAASYALIEEPVRRGRALPTNAARRALAATGLVLVVASGAVGLLVADRSASTEQQLATAARRLRQPTATTPATVPADESPLPHSAPLRVAFFGDSTALMTAEGIKSWAAADPVAMEISGDPRLGCPVIDDGRVMFAHGQPSAVLDTCRDRDGIFRAHLASRPADVAVLQYGPWDVAERVLPSEDRWRHIGDPVYDDALRREMGAATDALVDLGVDVVWLTAPDIEARSPDGRSASASEDARLARFNQLVREVVGERPEAARVIDLAGYLGSHPDGAPRGRLRPDGVHFTHDGALEVAERWLGRALLDAVDSLRRGTPP